jgi:cellulose synthase/poly-beta-1,6-N-acetylglucosamine synthase-like glycosyltransferase
VIEQILRYLVLTSFAVPFFTFVVYGSILLYYYKKNKKYTEYDQNKEFEPMVSVVVPTHNEEEIIEKKIENLLACKYPIDKLEFIFVDDSNDSTPNIIQKCSEESGQIRLLRFNERMGYSPCMMAGCNAAKGKIIVFNDAGSFLDAQAIQNLVRNFQNQSVGAVTGRDIILNVDEAVGRSEALYQKIYNFVRLSETNMDSTFYFKGEASAVRKDLVVDLPDCSATFDTAAALFIRQKGYKSIYNPQVKFYEYAPKTHSERIKQKTIRAANWIKILYQFRHMVFKPKYGKFGMIVLPMNLAMLVVSPLSMLTGTILLSALTFYDLAFSSIIWGILATSISLIFIFSKSLLYTFLEFNYSLLKAIYEIFTKRKHDMIEKVPSTRR